MVAEGHIGGSPKRLRIQRVIVMKFFLISDNTDAMIGMRLAGIEAKRVTSRDEAEKAFKKALSAEDIGILLITAGVAELCPETVKKLKQSNRPLLVTIPDGDGNGRNRDSITEYIRDAIGIKI